MIKHKKNTPKADGDDAGRVQPSDWNDDHEVDGLIGALLPLAAVPGVPYLADDGAGAVAPSTAAGRGLLAIDSLAALLTALGAAPIDSPVFLNTPRAPTPDLLDNSTRIATTQFVKALVAALVDSSPSALDTLNELATALGDDPNFATTMTTALANRLRFDAAQSLTSGQKAQALLNLGVVLGTAAALDVGTAANKVVQLDGTAKLPAVDGSQLLNVTATNGAVRYDTAQTLAIGDQARSRQNIGADTLPGHLFGLVLSNNTSDATNGIDVSTGSAADDAGLFRMVLTSALTKKLNAAWTVGTGNGGLDTGIVTNTTYHVWLIQRSDTGIVDALFSTSAASPTMPSNYDRKRRIGSIIRSGGSILAFTQSGDNFDFVNEVEDASAATYAAVATDYMVALTVPAGISVRALLNIHGGGTAGNMAWGSVNQNLISSNSGSIVSNTQKIFAAIQTNSSRQVKTRTSNTAATYTIGTLGWIDTRGRLAP